MFSLDLRVEPGALGDLGTDAIVGLEGFVARWRPICPGLRVGIDPDSDGEGSSAVRSIEVPLLARFGLCSRGQRFLVHGWIGAGFSFVSVTTEVAGVGRTDNGVVSLFGAAVDGLARFHSLAGLVGLGAELSGDRWALSLRLGFGAWG